MTKSPRTFWLTLVTVTVVVVSTVVPAAAAPPALDPHAACAGLHDAGRTQGGETEVVDAGGDLPEYCRVTGTVSQTINFEMRLPTTEWNGKFYMTGCGGFCGNVDADACNGALSRGYAIVATDTGHTGSALDGSWGLDNRPAEVDWAFRAVHLVATNSKQLIHRFYGMGPSFSYFSGCSGGGREALMSAQSYPNDFDGIIAGAPANFQAYLAGVSQTWIELAQFDEDGNRVLGVEKLPILADAVYAGCDGIDGLIDGQIDDPRNCDFDLDTLACPDGTNGPTCLTPEETEALSKIYDSPRSSDGQALYPGGLPHGLK